MRVIVVPIHPLELRFDRKTKTDICREWNTHVPIIPEIPSKRAHSKRIPKFSKTYTGTFPVPFDFRPEISKILVEWKAPLVAVTLKCRTYGKITESGPKN